jgi:hypothetical protein
MIAMFALWPNRFARQPKRKHRPRCGAKVERGLQKPSAAAVAFIEKGGKETSLANVSSEGVGVQIEGHRWWRVLSPLIARRVHSTTECLRAAPFLYVLPPPADMYMRR